MTVNKPLYDHLTTHFSTLLGTLFNCPQHFLQLSTTIWKLSLVNFTVHLFTSVVKKLNALWEESFPKENKTLLVTHRCGTSKKHNITGKEIRLLSHSLLCAWKTVYPLDSVPKLTLRYIIMGQHEVPMAQPSAWLTADLKFHARGNSTPCWMKGKMFCTNSIDHLWMSRPPYLARISVISRSSYIIKEKPKVSGIFLLLWKCTEICEYILYELTCPQDVFKKCWDFLREGKSFEVGRFD